MTLARLALAAGVLLSQSAHADVLHDIQSSGRVRIAIASGVPPFNDFDANRKLVGSDIDTAELLAQDLQVKLEIVPISNSERVNILVARRAQLVISALSITPQREREIAFSVPYAKISVVIAAPEPMTLSSMLDLNGHRVGALAQSSNLSHLLSHSPGARVIQYEDNDKMVAGYIAGEFEIMTAPESVVRMTNARKPPKPLQVQFKQSEFEVAIGLNHGEKAMRDWVNAWVVANLRNGKLSEIYRKHHGVALPQGILPANEPIRKP